jgi:hypothetical protein
MPCCGANDIDADTALALASLGPFGSGNPRPRLMLVDAAVRQVEVTRTGGHLRCLVEVDGAKGRAIGFGMGDRAEGLREDPTGRVLGVQLRVDEWQGAQRPEFLLDRIGPGRTEREGEAVVLCGLSCPTAARSMRGRASDRGPVACPLPDKWPAFQ